MVYNNQYNRYGGYYNPQQPMYQQPMYQQQINIQDLPIEAVRFMSDTEAKGFVVLPNHKELLVVKETGTAYLKATDSAGNSIFKVFKFEEMQDTKAPVFDTTKYLTRDDVKNFVSRKDFDELARKIENFQQQKAKA